MTHDFISNAFVRLNFFPFLETSFYFETGNYTKNVWISVRGKQSTLPPPLPLLSSYYWSFGNFIITIKCPEWIILSLFWENHRINLKYFFLTKNLQRMIPININNKITLEMKKGFWKSVKRYCHGTLAFIESNQLFSLSAKVNRYLRRMFT